MPLLRQVTYWHIDCLTISKPQPIGCRNGAILLYNGNLKHVATKRQKGGKYGKEYTRGS
jgi:hypothetical protein